MKTKIILNTIIISIFCCVTASAEDIQAIFQRVKELADNKNYSKAIEELSWAKKELEKMNAEKIQSFLPDKVLELNGDKPQSNSALGFTNIERTYSGADASIKVSLTGSGGNAAGLGGLAQLGKMAAMFGGEGTNQETIRVAGKTATLEKGEGTGNTSLTVFLDSGSILKLDLTKGSDAEKLKSFAEALKLQELDTYLKG
jgi:hypothetical protein